MSNRYLLQTIEYKGYSIGIVFWRENNTTGMVFDKEKNILFSTSKNSRSQLKTIKDCEDFIDTLTEKGEK